MSSYDSFLDRELARHHAALDRAEREADERRERLPDTLQADIEEADMDALASIIAGDSMLSARFAELLNAAIRPDAHLPERTAQMARDFGAELVSVCVDLCVELNRDTLPWDSAEIDPAMRGISARRHAEMLRVASFAREAA